MAKAKALTDADRRALQATLSADRSGLTSLRARLDAETTAQAAEADARQVVAAYRVYAVVEPQVRMAIADMVRSHPRIDLRRAGSTPSRL